MTEEETFRKLKRRPFEEVRADIVKARKRRSNISADIKLLKKAGWTYKEYVTELKLLIDKLNGFDYHI